MKLFFRGSTQDEVHDAQPIVNLVSMPATFRFQKQTDGLVHEGGQNGPVVWVAVIPQAFYQSYSDTPLLRTTRQMLKGFQHRLASAVEAVPQAQEARRRHLA